MVLWTAEHVFSLTFFSDFFVAMQSSSFFCLKNYIQRLWQCTRVIDSGVQVHTSRTLSGRVRFKATTTTMTQTESTTFSAQSLAIACDCTVAICCLCDIALFNEFPYIFCLDAPVRACKSIHSSFLSNGCQDPFQHFCSSTKAIRVTGWNQLDDFQDVVWHVSSTP